MIVLNPGNLRKQPAPLRYCGSLTGEPAPRPFSPTPLRLPAILDLTKKKN